MRLIPALSLIFLSFSLSAGTTPASGGAEVYIISPQSGETVSSPITVVMGLKGMGVAPAGVTTKNTGHHHLIIDSPLPDLDKPVPKDQHHRHFGGGQTEAQIELVPGTHNLQLLLGDFAHIPHATPVFSEVVTISVE